jgi:hypothetical protein
MTARQSAEGDRLLCEAEDLLSRLWAARRATQDAQRIVRIRRAAVAAHRRYRRRLVKFFVPLTEVTQ